MDEWVKSYKHEYMSKFDLLVVLELIGWRPQIRCEGLWACPESVCQISQLYHSVIWAAIDSHCSIIIIGKCRKTIGVSQLRCLTPNNYSVSHRPGSNVWCPHLMSFPPRSKEMGGGEETRAPGGNTRLFYFLYNCRLLT